MAILGCIADDFTGASDAASFLVKGGMSVQLYNGIPENTKDLKPVQAIVIALKSRTQETSQAVSDSLHAARFLLEQGVSHTAIAGGSELVATARLQTDLFQILLYL